MKKIAVENAVGMTLCHDVTAIVDGFKGPLFKRGHVIAADDVPRLLNIGKTHLFVWEENAGEVHEEDCALRFAAMAPVEGAHYTGPSEGKVTLIADRRGMFRADTALQKQLNSIPDVTVTSLPDHYPVEAGARLASMRIIPLVTREENIARAEALCAGKQLFRLLPYRPMRAAIIITGSEVYSGRIRDKFEAVARARLAKYPCEIVSAAICDDDMDMLRGAADSALAAGADLIVFHGGMSVDPDDLTPTAIRALGAEIISYGVPAQPGNMSLVAYLGGVTILGVPSSAISNRTSMFDVVLPQVFAGERFTKDDLTNLGNGGLCQQCETCTFPNCTFGKY
jgi:hypothetical protein